MATIGQSREVLTAETSQSASSLSFNKRGFHVNRRVAVLIGGVFVCAAVAAGVIAYSVTRPGPSSPPADPQSVFRPRPPVARPTPPPVLYSEDTSPSTDDGNSSATTSTEPPPEPEIDMRLPTSIRPINYEIDLQPFLYGNFSFTGTMSVTMNVMEATENITLHIREIVIDEDSVTVVREDGGGEVAVDGHDYDSDRQFYIVFLKSELEEDKNYTLSLKYTGKLNDDLDGFYRSSYLDADGEERWIASSHFEPVSARRAFPCFDEPAMKATFDISILRQNHMTSISNMPQKESTPEGDTWMRDVYDRTVVMSTYLVAFVVSDFEHKNYANEDGPDFRVWARSEFIDQTNYAITKGPELLAFFENYFSVPFPLPKQDMIALPEFSAGAMENWGLITYRETALLLNEDECTTRNKERVTTVMSHELAHQWFGNLVTMEWWNDLWLNEGFASFVQLLGTDEVTGKEWRVMDKFVTEELQAVMELDSLASSHPISVDVQNPNEIGEIFDSISYSKGASVLRMLMFFMTEDNFKAGVSAYLKALEYQNAVQDDLWKYLDGALEDDFLPKDTTIKKIMDTWTLQTGFPVIEVKQISIINPFTKGIKLSQERFMLEENKNLTGEGRWWVPLTYTTQKNPDFTNTKTMSWLPPNDTEVEITEINEEEWFILNIQQTGFYKVNYYAKNWENLAKKLKDDHTAIHEINRAQLIDDALDFARAKQLEYNDALNLISYLDKEVDYYPWQAAMSNLAYLEKMFTRTGGYGELKAFLLKLLGPAYEHLGFDDEPGDDATKIYARELVRSWSCNLDHEECVKTAVVRFRMWMTNSSANPIEPNLKGTVFCTGVAEGGEEAWEAVWQQYKVSSISQEKDLILSALGCTKEVWLLARYLQYSFEEDSGVRKQDASRVFAKIARNDIGRDLAWNYVREKWLHIANYVGSNNTLGSLVSVVSEEFNTNEDTHQLTLFKEYLAETTDVSPMMFDQSLEKTRVNIAWMETHYDTIVAWLTDFNNNDTPDTEAPV